LSAEVLLAHVLRCRRIDLYTRYDYQPSAAELAAYRGLVARAGTHEPVAYLVGWKEFYSLRFKVTADVMIPRPETESLVTEALGHIARLPARAGRPVRVWDICTGSGCVAVAVAAQAPQVQVLATDICPGAVAVAAENAGAHGVSARVSCRVADLLTLPADCGDFAEVQVITANPPYVAEGDVVAQSVKHEPRVALYAGKDGLSVIRRIVAEAPPLLAPGGALVVEFGCGQGDAVRDLIADIAAFDEPGILRDHQAIERTAVAVKRR
jgi:release factor glutamine methyltransferase